MVRRGALERCETGANPLETRGKRKPVTPENDPRETGLSFLIGGVQFTTEQLAVRANEHWRGLLRQRAHEPSITRATSP